MARHALRMSLREEVDAQTPAPMKSSLTWWSLWSGSVGADMIGGGIGLAFGPSSGLSAPSARKPPILHQGQVRENNFLSTRKEKNKTHLWNNHPPTKLRDMRFALGAKNGVKRGISGDLARNKRHVPETRSGIKRTAWEQHLKKRSVRTDPRQEEKIQ